MVVTSCAVIELRNQLKAREHRREGKGGVVEIESDIAWSHVQLTLEQILNPVFREEGPNPVPVQGTSCQAVLEEVVQAMEIPRCISGIFSKILCSIELSDILSDCFWGVLGLLYLHSTHKKPRKKRSSHPVDFLTTSTMTTIKEFFNNHDKGVNKLLFRSLIEETLSIYMRPGQLEHTVKGLTDGAPLVQYHHIEELMLTREMVEYEGEDYDRFQNRISCNVGKIMYKNPLKARDILSEVLCEVVPLTVYRIVSRLLLATPSCDPSVDRVRLFMKQAIVFWISGIPFSSVDVSSAIWAGITKHSISARVDLVLGRTRNGSDFKHHRPVTSDGSLRRPNPPHNTPESKTGRIRLFTPGNRQTSRLGRARDTPEGLPESERKLVSLLDDEIEKIRMHPSLAEEVHSLRASIKKVRDSGKVFKRPHTSCAVTAVAVAGETTSSFPPPRLLQTSPFGVATHSLAFLQWSKTKGIPPAPPTVARKPRNKVAWLQ
eukprot:TRINITY_DN22980_c0_g1_i1.p1 TRINITY_DN22980_c0_g1~~TRINITY_DN22980_c0_g1_i1.p1  ORF type:complete len:507 (+),score=58.95 TRINITY_DN22980_c0_g1_i1:57-1523(+)